MSETKLSFRDRLLRFIPFHVKNKTVLGFFEFLRHLQGKHKRRAEKHLWSCENVYKKLLDSAVLTKGFIENQNALGDMPYGKRDMAYSGCEIIAAYNALICLEGKSDITFPKLINRFEKNGMVLSGKFGTSPKAVLKFFEDCGFKTGLCLKESEFEVFALGYDTLILTLYNDRFNIKKQVHTVNIEIKDKNFIAHNVYGDGTVIGPLPTLSNVIKAINGGRAKGIALIGIGERNEYRMFKR